MDFELLVRRFGILFSFFGITSFSAPIKSEKERRINFVEIFPAIFYFVFVVGLFVAATWKYYSSLSNYATMNSIFAHTYLCSEICLQLAFVNLAIVCRERLKDLYRAFDFMQNYMKFRMKHNVEFSVFQKRLYQLTIIIFVSHTITVALRNILNVRDINTFYYYSRGIFHVLASLVQLHVIAHVELLKFFLALMTRWLQKQANDISALSLYLRKDLLKEQQLSGYDKILQLKLIHFKLWEITLNFNRIFGWSVGIIIMRNSLEIAYKAYWVCLYSFRGAEYAVILRKLIVLSSWHWDFLTFSGIFRTSSDLYNLYRSNCNTDQCLSLLFHPGIVDANGRNGMLLKAK